MRAVQTKLTAVIAWDSMPAISDDLFAGTEVPLAGESLHEANDLNEFSQLVAWTPCTRTTSTFEINLSIPPMILNSWENERTLEVI